MGRIAAGASIVFMGWGPLGLAQQVAPEAAPASAPTFRMAFEEGRDRLAGSLLGFKPSAFGDVCLAPDAQGRKRLDWGAFELDLAGELHENLDLALAVVSTQEATQMPVAFLDFHPFGGTIAPRGRLWAEKGFHIQAGRFDVPFGNDWQFFASKDSVSISRPITTDTIMDGGYNDVGLRVLGNNGDLNFNFFLLRGFGDGRLAGGRLGLTPFGNPFSLQGSREPKSAEFGLSLLYDTDRTRQKTGLAWAADAEARLGDWYLRAEYLWRRTEADLTQARVTRHGWHLTQEWGFPQAWLPTTLFLRYERMTDHPDPALPGDPLDIRLAGGLSAGIAGFFQIKVEWQHTLRAMAGTRESPGFNQNLWLAQLVVVL